MSDTLRQNAIPSLPPASLDLINRSIRPVDRFATPNLAIKQKARSHIYFLAFLVPFLLISFTHFLLPKPTKLLLPDLTKEESQYLLFLDSARSARLHTLREVLFGMALISISASVCMKIRLNQKPVMTQYVVCAGLALIFGLGMIQIGRLHSYEAEYYALEHQKNPDAMISVSQKIYETWGGPKTENVFSFLFSRSVPYDSSVHIAQSYKIQAAQHIPLRYAKPTPSPTLQPTAIPELTPEDQAQIQPVETQ